MRCGAGAGRWRAGDAGGRRPPGPCGVRLDDLLGAGGRPPVRAARPWLEVPSSLRCFPRRGASLGGGGAGGRDVGRTFRAGVRSLAEAGTGRGPRIRPAWAVARGARRRTRGGFRCSRTHKRARGYTRTPLRSARKDETAQSAPPQRPLVVPAQPTAACRRLSVRVIERTRRHGRRARREAPQRRPPAPAPPRPSVRAHAPPCSPGRPTQEGRRPRPRRRGLEGHRPRVGQRGQQPGRSGGAGRRERERDGTRRRRGKVRTVRTRGRTPCRSIQDSLPRAAGRAGRGQDPRQPARARTRLP